MSTGGQILAEGEIAPKFVEGVKFDGGKIRWDLVPYAPMENVAALYTQGAKKYEAHNWRKGIAYSRCFGALMRHLFAWWIKRETHDAETGCHHLSAVVFYCLNFMQYELDHTPNLDDRWVKP
jgi:hypothetical protein